MTGKNKAEENAKVVAVESQVSPEAITVEGVVVQSRCLKVDDLTKIVKELFADKNIQKYVDARKEQKKLRNSMTG